MFVFYGFQAACLSFDFHPIQHAAETRFLHRNVYCPRSNRTPHPDSPPLTTAVKHSKHQPHLESSRSRHYCGSATAKNSRNADTSAFQNRKSLMECTGSCAPFCAPDPLPAFLTPYADNSACFKVFTCAFSCLVCRTNRVADNSFFICFQPIQKSGN